jgi:hypothetical protein
VNRRLLLLLAALLVVPAPATAQITITFTFTNGTAADADQVNSNFSTLASQALNRTGGAITGNITASAGVTIDGVDVGAVLGGSGTPTFSTVTVTNAGATALTVTGGITAGSGTVGIVDTSGKIPALSTTYFASVSGANLTALNASELTSGTVPLARLVNITSSQILDLTIENGDISATAAIAWTKVSKAGSSLADLATRSHSELSDGANVAMLNAAAAFTSTVSVADTLTLTARYLLLPGEATVTLGAANETVSPGNASVLMVSNSDIGFSIQTINGGVDGRILYVCNASGSTTFAFAGGGNLPSASGGIPAGSCTALRYRTADAVWYYL